MLFPLLLILHFLGLVAGFGGGIGLSQVGPRLANAEQVELPLLLKLQGTFNAISLVGLLLLLITGPLMLWQRFGGTRYRRPAGLVFVQDGVRGCCSACSDRESGRQAAIPIGPERGAQVDPRHRAYHRHFDAVCGDLRGVGVSVDWVAQTICE